MIYLLLQVLDRRDEPKLDTAGADYCVLNSKYTFSFHAPLHLKQTWPYRQPNQGIYTCISIALCYTTLARSQKLNMKYFKLNTDKVLV